MGLLTSLCSRFHAGTEYTENVLLDQQVRVDGAAFLTQLCPDTSFVGRPKSFSFFFATIPNNKEQPHGDGGGIQIPSGCAQMLQLRVSTQDGNHWVAILQGQSEITLKKCGS